MKPFEPDPCSAVASSEPDSETEEDRASKPSFMEKFDEAEQRLIQKEVSEKRSKPCVLEDGSFPSQLCLRESILAILLAAKKAQAL